MSLTKDQQAALAAIKTWWESDSPEFILSGEPGTGKTFCAKYAIDQLPNAITLFTAPTNEAVYQLQQALGNFKAEVTTTHKALGLSMSTGSQEQKLIQVKAPELDDYNLLLVDEASMVGKQVLDDPGLLEYIRDTGIRVLWVGDPLQLPPIHAARSPVFLEGLPTYHLTQVVRHGGLLGKFVKDLRETFEERFFKFPAVAKKGDGINWIKPPQLKTILFEEQNFKRFISGEAKFITYINKRSKHFPGYSCDEINEKIREHRYGAEVANAQKYCPGDHVLFAKPLMLDRQHPAIDQDFVKFYKEDTYGTVVTTNAKAEVVKVDYTKLWDIECYKLTLSIEGKYDKTVLTPTKAGERSFNKLKNGLANEAKAAAKKGNWQLKKLKWQHFHAVSNVFANLKMAYAITGHRSQGSTIPYVFVDANNLLSNRNKIVGVKNLLVACSRAREGLTIVSNKPIEFGE